MKLAAEIATTASLLQLYIVLGKTIGDIPSGKEIMKKDMESSASSYVFGRNGLGQYGGLGGIGSKKLTTAFRNADLSNSRYNGLSTADILGQLYGGFNFPAKYGLGHSRGNLGKDITLGNYKTINVYENIEEDDEDEDEDGSFGISDNGLDLNGLDKGLELGRAISGLRTSPLARIGNLGYNNVDIQLPVSVDDGVLGVSRKAGGKTAFKKGKGSKVKATHEEAAGKESKKGYKSAEGFDKGEEGALEKSHQSGHHHTSEGTKKGEEEEQKGYRAAESTEKGEKGGSFHKSDGHNKGHKTSGFHNVYHKDEYKKDTTFYDDSHSSGHKESHETENVHHSNAEGAHEKAQKVDGAFHEDESSKKGSFTNGHQYGTVQGHDREEGKEEQYENEEEYAKRDDQEVAKKVASSLIGRKIL